MKRFISQNNPWVEVREVPSKSEDLSRDVLLWRIFLMARYTRSEEVAKRERIAQSKIAYGL